MRFYPRKAPRKKVDILVDKIASGKCDELVISELKVAIAEIADPEERQRVSWAVLDIAMNSTNMAAVAYAIKSIILFMPMARDIENALDNRVLVLVEDKSASTNKVLIEAIASYARERISVDIDRSKPYIPATILFLEECNGTAASVSYEVLMNVAASRPEFFKPYTTLLTRELGSINNATRIYTARIITRLARTHPEYMAEAEKTLLHISTFYPDAEVKSAAAEAYQTITQNRIPTQPEPEVAPQPRIDSAGGLAEIMRKKASDRDKKQNSESRIDNRLLSLAANFARKSDMRNGQGKGKADALAVDPDNEAMDKIIDDFSEIAGVITGNGDSDRQAKPAEEKISREEAELRDMVAKVKMDFSESAESLLDSLGMKHLHKDQQTELLEAGPESQAIVQPGPAGETSEAPQVIDADVSPAPTPAEAIMAPAPRTVETRAAAGENIDDGPDSLTSIKNIIEGSDSVTAETGQEAAIPEQALPETRPDVSEPVPPALIEATVPETGVKAPEEVTTDNVQVPQELPVQSTNAEALDTRSRELAASVAKQIKSPIIPEGVRISAVKFKTLDQNKKQPPAKVSIKPHIKPLNRTPRDINKIMQQRPQAASAQQADMKSAEGKADAVQANVVDIQQNVESMAAELTVCPSCGEKVTGDQQYCLKCGTDLKSLKVRCPRCSQINARDTGTCVRCGAKLVRSPAIAKQPDIL